MTQDSDTTFMPSEYEKAKEEAHLLYTHGYPVTHAVHEAMDKIVPEFKNDPEYDTMAVGLAIVVLQLPYQEAIKSLSAEDLSAFYAELQSTLLYEQSLISQHLLDDPSWRPLPYWGPTRKYYTLDSECPLCGSMVAEDYDGQHYRCLSCKEYYLLVEDEDAHRELKTLFAKVRELMGTKITPYKLYMCHYDDNSGLVFTGVVSASNKSQARDVLLYNYMMQTPRKITKARIQVARQAIYERIDHLKERVIGTTAYSLPGELLHRNIYS